MKKRTGPGKRKVQTSENLNNPQPSFDKDNDSLISQSDPLVFKTNGNTFFKTNGNTFKDLGNYPKALKNYDRYLALKPNDAEVLANRGWVLDKLKRHEEAIKSYSRSLDLTKGFWTLDAATFKSRAIAFKNLGSYQGALIGYNTYLNMEPNDAEAQADRGWIAHHLKDYRTALKSYNHLLVLRPNHVPALHGRSEVLSNLGRFTEAMQDCKLCLELEPNYAPALDNRSKILRGLATKKEKVEIHFFAQVHVKVIKALHYTIVRPIFYIISYLTVPIRKTKNLPSLVDIPALNNDPVKKTSTGSPEETEDIQLESTSETVSTKEMKAKKRPKKKPPEEKHKKLKEAEPFSRDIITTANTNCASDPIMPPVLYEATEISNSLYQKSVPGSGKFLNSNSAINDIAPASSWGNKFFLSTRKFFEYFFKLLYINFIIKITAVFKSSNEKAVLSNIEGSQDKIKKTISLESSNHADKNHQEAQNPSDKPIAKPNLGSDMALQETKEQMSEIEIRLQEQEKTILFMKQQFDKLQKQSTRLKRTEQTEPFQIQQKQQGQDNVLKQVCEAQMQRIQFLESEIQKYTQKPSLEDLDTAHIAAEINQLKDQLRQLQCLCERTQSQILSISVAESVVPEHNTPILTPQEPSLTVSDRLFDVLQAYQSRRTDGRISCI